MSSYSKLINNVLENISCRKLIHPQQTCFEYFCATLPVGIIPLASFYFPTVVIPVLLNYKSWNKEMIWCELKTYVLCILSAAWLAGLSFPSFCATYKIFGRIHYPSGVFTPIFVAVIGTAYNLPLKIRLIQSHQLFNFTLTVWIKKSNNQLIKLFRNSKYLSTLLFMFSSMGIMYGFKTTNLKRFWFASPAQVNSDILDDRNDKICRHPGNCKTYIKQKMKKAFGFTLLLGLTKATSAFKEIRNPMKFLKLLLKKFDYALTKFILSYTAIFYVLNCWLNNRTKKNSLKNCLIAGFFSGLSYVFFPKYLIFSYGLTTAFLNIWNSLISVNKSKPEWLDRFDKLPFSRLFLIFSSGTIFIYRFVYPYYTPKYVHQLMALMTRDRSEFVAENVANILLGYGPITDQFKRYYF